MATQKDIIKRHLQAFSDIKAWTIDYVNEEIIDQGLTKSEQLAEYKEVVKQANFLIDVALGQAIYDEIDEENLAMRTTEENTRNVPIEPISKANYILSRIKSDVERYRACRDYNIKRGVDVKAHGIKYEFRLTKQEYRDIAKDYKYIMEMLNSDLKKHKPVFEELIMKGLTLEEYGRLKNPTIKNRQYLIKWAHNKKTSFINALGKCYAKDMSSMNYYQGIQDEKGTNCANFYFMEREIVGEALLNVDNGSIDYFEAMKNAYNQLYEYVTKFRKEN